MYSPISKLQNPAGLYDMVSKLPPQQQNPELQSLEQKQLAPTEAILYVKNQLDRLRAARQPPPPTTVMQDMQAQLQQAQMAPQSPMGQGISSLPVQNVGQPQNYAGGGIVAFNGGGYLGLGETAFGLPSVASSAARTINPATTWGGLSSELGSGLRIASRAAAPIATGLAFKGAVDAALDDKENRRVFLEYLKRMGLTYDEFLKLAPESQAGIAQMSGNARVLSGLTGLNLTGVPERRKFHSGEDKGLGRLNVGERNEPSPPTPPAPPGMSMEEYLANINKDSGVSGGAAAPKFESGYDAKFYDDQVAGLGSLDRNEVQKEIEARNAAAGIGKAGEAYQKNIDRYSKQINEEDAGKLGKFLQTMGLTIAGSTGNVLQALTKGTAAGVAVIDKIKEKQEQLEERRQSAEMELAKYKEGIAAGVISETDRRVEKAQDDVRTIRTEQARARQADVASRNTLAGQRWEAQYRRETEIIATRLQKELGQKPEDRLMQAWMDARTRAADPRTPNHLKPQFEAEADRLLNMMGIVANQQASVLAAQIRKENNIFPPPPGASGGANFPAGNWSVQERK